MDIERMAELYLKLKGSIFLRLEASNNSPFDKERFIISNIYKRIIVTKKDMTFGDFLKKWSCENV